MRSKEFQNDCAIYYPTKRRVDEKGNKLTESNVDNTVKFLSYGDYDVDALINITKWRTGDQLPRFVLKSLMDLTVPVVSNGPLADEFKNDGA